MLFDKPLTLHDFPVGQLRSLDSLFAQELKTGYPCVNRFSLHCRAGISLVGLQHYCIRVGNLSSTPSTSEMLSLAFPLVIEPRKRLEPLLRTVSLNYARLLLPLWIDLSDGGADNLCDNCRILVFCIDVLAMGSSLTALTPRWEFADWARLNQYVLSEFLNHTSRLVGIILKWVSILGLFSFKSSLFSEVSWRVFGLNCT